MNAWVAAGQPCATVGRKSTHIGGSRAGNHSAVTRTARKMRQTLFSAAVYNMIASPMAAGVLYAAFGRVLGPEFGALAM